MPGGGGQPNIYDTHVALIILTTQMWGGKLLVEKNFSGQNLCSCAFGTNIRSYTKQRAQHGTPPPPPSAGVHVTPPPPPAEQFSGRPTKTRITVATVVVAPTPLRPGPGIDLPIDSSTVWVDNPGAWGVAPYSPLYRGQALTQNWLHWTSMKWTHVC